ncbi:MAG: histidine--tRNA ligase [Patescibacteria group bacterium]
MVKKIKKEFVRSPKGMHDMLSADISYFDKFIARAKEIVDYYGFSEIKTPHVEYAELFMRPLGETSDVVQKEMYMFRTKGGDLLALRPEGTAAIMRAYAEHGMASWPQPVKLFYEGSFFRHENPQRGRFREFRQFGIEILGDADPVSDALIIKVSYLTLLELGFKNIMVHINSIGNKDCRPAYKKELANYYRKKFNYLCKNCKRRLKENPLRILDCKEQSCVELREHAPQMIEYLCEACKTHFRGVLEFLDESKIPYLLDHYLVRGFDYYGKTVFEIFIEDIQKDSIAQIPTESAKEQLVPIALVGGGRYDDLMMLLGGKQLPATGASIGIERIIHEMKLFGFAPKIFPSAKVFVIQIGSAAKKKSFVLIDAMRDAGIKVSSSLSKDSIKTQLNIAAKTGARIALIIGQKEAMEGSVIMRDMDEGIQETVMENRLVEKLKAKLKTKK